MKGERETGPIGLDSGFVVVITDQKAVITLSDCSFPSKQPPSEFIKY